MFIFIVIYTPFIGNFNQVYIDKICYSCKIIQYNDIHIFIKLPILFIYLRLQN